MMTCDLFGFDRNEAANEKPLPGASIIDLAAPDPGTAQGGHGGRDSTA